MTASDRPPVRIGVIGRASWGASCRTEVVGGFHGASYMTGTALTKALVFGVEAADAIARG